MTEISRRNFIGGAVAAAGLCGCGKTLAPTFTSGTKDKPIWTYLIHLGINSWKDVPLATAPKDSPERYLTRCCADFLRCDMEEWNFVTNRLAEMGANQIIIDLAEGISYPSHPELAVKGTWSVDRIRAELKRLRGMGLEPIPKLNFSACHDTWLKDYGRMVSTKKYYEVCADLIKDVCEIFDHPRFFHIGYDEETANHQRGHLLAIVRQGELWWHDFLYISGCVEKQGVRPWIWSDYVWHHKDEFLKRMPKSVLQSNWYYGAQFDTSKMGDRSPHVAAYEWLDKAGFDQVPTGSNWSCDTNFADTIKFCRAKCSPDRIKGYMMAPWTRTFNIHHEKSVQALDQLAAAIKAG